MQKRAILFSSIMLLGIAHAAHVDEPYVPASDAVVLESNLRTSGSDGTMRTRQLALRADMRSAVDFARSAIEKGSEEGDPRFFGYAQSALKPWWTLVAPDPEVRLMRATIRQWQHDFVGAERDLDAIIAADGKAVTQAHLTRAAVEMVQGAPDLARRDCIELLNHADALLTATCIATANAMLGHTESSAAALSLAIEQARQPNVSSLEWAYTSLAEMHDRLGRFDLSANDYVRALQASQDSGHRDPYLLASFSDFLLDRSEPERVVQMLTGLERIDNLLLRLTLAEQMLAARDPVMAARATKHIAELQQRFDETRERGDFVHQREEALFLLNLKRQPAEALRVAEENWSRQKELTDARLLLSAARAAGMPQAAEPVHSWVRRFHIEDRYLSS
jgi:tetratricopeptide (TPR) repeat protein